jgi:GNAT superfamily N-acetyltransferase
VGKKVNYTMNNLLIRDARDGDREAIQNITLSAYLEYAAIMPAHWEDYRQNILDTLAEVKPAEQIVAEQAGAIVGTVLMYPAGTILDRPDETTSSLEWPEVRLLAVAPAARGQGVGAALMRECIQRARRAGVAALTLHTTEMMQVAIRMYERMGFVRMPQLDFHPAEDENVIIKGYRLTLNDMASK